MSEQNPHYVGHRGRLRSRLLDGGGDTMPDYELLELILFAAHPRGDTKPLAKRLLAAFDGSFAKLCYAPEGELRKIDEVGDAVIAALLSVRIASQRLLRSEIKDSPVIHSWSALIDYCTLRMGKNTIEEFHVLFLNHRHTLIADEIMQRGTVNHTPVYPREIVKRALELSASSMILVHNHPSGDPSPSKADIDITSKIVDAAATVGVAVHDHVIITDGGHYSFRSYGLL